MEAVETNFSRYWNLYISGNYEYVLYYACKGFDIYKDLFEMH